MWIAMVVILATAAGPRQVGIYDELEYATQKACEDAAPALKAAMARELASRGRSYYSITIHCEYVL